MKQFYIGQLIDCEIEDQIEKDVYIVSLAGNLLRIRNSSASALKTGDRVRLWVKSVDPLSFQIVTDGKKRIQLVV